MKFRKRIVMDEDASKLIGWESDQNSGYETQLPHGRHNRWFYQDQLILHMKDSEILLYLRFDRKRLQCYIIVRQKGKISYRLHRRHLPFHAFSASSPLCLYPNIKSIQCWRLHETYSDSSASLCILTNSCAEPFAHGGRITRGRGGAKKMSDVNYFNFASTGKTHVESCSTSPSEQQRNTHVIDWLQAHYLPSLTDIPFCVLPNAKWFEFNKISGVVKSSGINSFTSLEDVLQLFQLSFMS